MKEYSADEVLHDVVNLDGDYVCRLSCYEHNVWTRYARALPKYAELLDAFMRRDAAIAVGNHDTAVYQQRVIVDCNTALHDIASAWHLDLIGQRAARDAKSKEEYDREQSDARGEVPDSPPPS